MIERLNPWQRFWAMFGLVSLMSVFVLIIAMWPGHDAGIVADLRDPACQQWRAVVDRGEPVYYPEVGEPCRSMRIFRFDNHFTLHSEAEYDSHLRRTGLRYALTALVIWAGFMALLYVLGLLAKKLVDALPGRHRHKAD